MNQTIFNSEIVTKSKLNNINYTSKCCMVSGGKDSDVVLDHIIKNGGADYYIYIDTGLEYKATKEHIKYLENKYNIKILIEKPLLQRTQKGVLKKRQSELPIPLSVKIHGVPFLNKQVSEYIERLQRNDFKWEDRTYDELIQLYPNCKIALMWWCNQNPKGSCFNIERNKYLKEFMISNKPYFRISNKCCLKSKKNVAERIKRELKCDLSIVGIRNAEGGSRTFQIKSCFSNKEDYDEYRPIFWYSDEDVKEYIEETNVINSDCYLIYGLRRTGCVGCPFGRNFERELEIIKEYEPNLYKAVTNIFKDSYEYTRKYRIYVEKHTK